jgi:hypothetical protein
MPAAIARGASRGRILLKSPTSTHAARKVFVWRLASGKPIF